MGYMEVVGEEGRSTGRQVKFETRELFHKKPLRAEYTFYSKGDTGEQWSARLKKKQTAKLEQLKEIEQLRLSISKQG